MLTAQSVSETKSPVALNPNQPQHVANLGNILTGSTYAVDTSPMGAGKTYTSNWLIQYFTFTHVVVICPASMVSKWRDVSQACGVGPERLIRIVSYESLRSRRHCQPKHGLLRRLDAVIKDKSGKDVVTTTFSITEGFKGLVKGGCLLIVDEMQRAKNDSDQHHALKALTNYIAEMRCTSRTLLLSATPVDKLEQLIRLMRLVGVITEPKLYTNHLGNLVLTGAQQLINYCRTLNADQTDAILGRQPIVSSGVHDICHALYLEVVQKYVVSCMPPAPVTISADVHNFYAKLNEVDAKIMERGIAELKGATNYDDDTGAVQYDGNSFGAITKALITIESAWPNTLVRLALHRLKTTPNCKMVLAFNYDEPMNLVAKALEAAGYPVLVITGKISKKLMEERRLAFQKHDLTHRVICGNMALMEIGIDLDDTHGGFPRYAYAIPNYMAMRMQQFWGRFVRAKTLSQAHVSFMYGKCKKALTSILSALSTKGNVMAATLVVQANGGMLFPNAYPTVDEA